MKLLLDEHLPNQPKNDLADFEVFTVQDMDGMARKMVNFSN